VSGTEVCDDVVGLSLQVGETAGGVALVGGGGGGVGGLGGLWEAVGGGLQGGGGERGGLMCFMSYLSEDLRVGCWNSGDVCVFV